jgi:hypothetical protein
VCDSSFATVDCAASLISILPPTPYRIDGGRAQSSASARTCKGSAGGAFSTCFIIICYADLLLCVLAQNMHVLLVWRSRASTGLCDAPPTRCGGACCSVTGSLRVKICAQHVRSIRTPGRRSSKIEFMLLSFVGHNRVLTFPVMV